MYIEKKCQHGELRRFFVPDAGGYVYDSTKNPGTLGKQICHGGRYTGSTVLLDPQNGFTREDLKQVVDKWIRARRYRLVEKGMEECWNCKPDPVNMSY